MTVLYFLTLRSNKTRCRTPIYMAPVLGQVVVSGVGALGKSREVCAQKGAGTSPHTAQPQPGHQRRAEGWKVPELRDPPRGRRSLGATSASGLLAVELTVAGELFDGKGPLICSKVLLRVNCSLLKLPLCYPCPRAAHFLVWSKPSENRGNREQGCFLARPVCPALKTALVLLPHLGCGAQGWKKGPIVNTDTT